MLQPVEDDDPPQLSAETFLALQEFYNEQNAKEAQLQADTPTEIAEDWQLSQFWYDAKTTNVLVDVGLKRVGPDGRIALISCPTLFNRFRENSTCDVRLFEYDDRFSKVCGARFTRYDYKSPLDVPKEFSKGFDLVIADPPFLSEDCLTKVAVTVKFLAKNDVILCTGEVMSDLAERLLHVKASSFRPSHRNNLANEFRCYSNFDLDTLLL
ncbi:hypothetical protein PPYR_14288 [Photinus pyralis]|uniref:Protein-lysine N-methyltransferase PPYR_14288 n=1 Tax=Photinus pyralis TaxID=7054 RepID=A0A1Y1KR80_PHOPY|nr:EEF1A lysine methyltransferase 1 isoform X1 [Photinus pyralis]KAB0792329.1 hypothetical protein PPYR_14288 [Photinus pyralis]